MSFSAIVNLSTSCSTLLRVANPRRNCAALLCCDKDLLDFRQRRDNKGRALLVKEGGGATRQRLVGRRGRSLFGDMIMDHDFGRSFEDTCARLKEHVSMKFHRLEKALMETYLDLSLVHILGLFDMSVCDGKMKSAFWKAYQVADDCLAVAIAS
jgi:hypothetical protein